MSGEAIIDGFDPKIRDAQACRNLHASEDTLRPLTSEVQTLIERLSAGRPPAALSSSISLTPPERHARRGPFRPRRRAWQTKSRYQRRRCSKRLRPWQVDALFEADAFALSIGLPLNTFLTVSWTDTSRGSSDIPQRFGRATKAMGEWLRRRSAKSCWVFVHENPGGTRPNAHLLIHIPGNLFSQFYEAAPRWFDALADGIYLRKRHGPRDHCLRYMVKGTDYATALRVGARARKQGGIDFKRCGWTQNLGVSARARCFRGDTQLPTGFR